MYILGVSDHVMIAHSFPDPFFGPAQNVHGATYGIDLEVRTPRLGKHHVVMDIGAMRTLLREVLAKIDYQNLDHHEDFKATYSTTERVAEYVAQRCRAAIAKVQGDGAPPAGGTIRIVVRESPVAYAAYECAL
jgi:6-pyruvoyltetrahydropterin/6-carboxytetrahydropterin synthase